MGQGLYRCVGWGCLNPPHFDWDDDDRPLLFDLVETSYEAEPNYIMIPFGVDDGWLQKAWNLPALPEGLPHVEPRTAVALSHCEWWPDVGKAGVWVSRRIRDTWELIRRVAKEKGLELPEGEPIFVCDWD